MKGEAEAEILSREELDALIAEMPGLLAERSAEATGTGSRETDVELERANEAFGFEYGRVLSNRHERVISLALIGQREIESTELAELMLPTDVVGSFRVAPRAVGGAVLLSRPFFFQMLCVLFGAGATIKSVRPPIREYTRIERRFYTRIVREMLTRLEEEWKGITQASLEWTGLLSRAAVAEGESRPTLLATYDVKGFAETCRVRLAVPLDAFRRAGAAPARSVKAVASAGPTLSEVPIRLRAEIGTAELPLAEVGRLRVGQSIALDVPSDGLLTIRIGEQRKFRGVGGTRGGRRAVQLQERIEATE